MARKVRRPALRIAVLALVPPAVLALLTIFRATGAGNEPGNAVEVTGEMPALEGPVLTSEDLTPSLSGGRITPALYQGKVVAVNFWASWCGPCREEQPGLQRLWDLYQDRGVQFIGVNFKDDRAAAIAYVKEFGVTYPSVDDPTGQLAFRFGVPYIPTTILVAADGEMRYRLLGAQPEANLRARIEELLSNA